MDREEISNFLISKRYKLYDQIRFTTNYAYCSIHGKTEYNHDKYDSFLGIIFQDNWIQHNPLHEVIRLEYSLESPAQIVLVSRLKNLLLKNEISFFEEPSFEEVTKSLRQSAAIRLRLADKLQSKN